MNTMYFIPFILLVTENFFETPVFTEISGEEGHHTYNADQSERLISIL